MRFIEFMPLDSARAWQKELVVAGREILERLQARFQLQPVTSANRSETAKRWAFADGRGELGLISPVSEPFCGHCNRLRLTADGKLRYCLFAIEEDDVKTLMRTGASDDCIAALIRRNVTAKWEGHEINSAKFVAPPRPMYSIGG